MLLKIYVTVNSDFNGKSIIQLPLRRLGFLIETDKQKIRGESVK